ARSLGQFPKQLGLVVDAQSEDDGLGRDEVTDGHQSGGRERYPIPVSVRMYSRLSVLRSIFCRRARIYIRIYCTSVSAPHMELQITLWVRTLPACAINNRSRSYSRGENLTS